jgi:pimeloyl-ACP methyl ester carboxylesterase
MRVNVGDIELHVREEGAGRPLVLLHGGPGLDGSVFFPEIGALAADGVRLLAVDHRANGRSDGGDPARWTVPQMAADVEAVMTQLQLERPIVMGHSFGSFVAQHHMAEYGSAAGYVLMGTVDSVEELARIGDRLAAFEPEHLREQVTRSWAEEATVETAAEAEQLWRDQVPFHAAEPEGAIVRAMHERRRHRLPARGAAPLRERRRVRPPRQPPAAGSALSARARALWRARPHDACGGCASAGGDPARRASTIVRWEPRKACARRSAR